MKTNLFTFFASALLFSAGAAFCAEKLTPPLYGEVVGLRAVDGGTATSVKVRRAVTGELVSAAKGTRFAPLDALITDANTIAQVNFIDGIALVLGKSTDVTLSERTPNADGIQTKVFVNEGIIRAKTIAAASKAGFQIHTKQAIITHLGSETIIDVKKVEGKWVVTVTQLEPQSRVTSTITGEGATLRAAGSQILASDKLGTLTQLSSAAIKDLIYNFNFWKTKPTLGALTKEDGVVYGTFVGNGSGGGTFTFKDQIIRSP